MIQRCECILLTRTTKSGLAELCFSDCLLIACFEHFRLASLYQGCYVITSTQHALSLQGYQYLKIPQMSPTN